VYRQIYLGKKDFEPVVQIGEDVGLLREASDPLFLRIVFWEWLPFIREVDFGGVAGNSQSPVTEVQELRTGQNEFLQVRFSLNPTDFTDPVNHQVQVFQPGEGTARWRSLNIVASWTRQAQDTWTTLHPTELFTTGLDTPRFRVVNRAATAMTASRVRFYGIRYVGVPLRVIDKMLQPNADDGRPWRRKDLVIDPDLDPWTRIPVGGRGVVTFL
jgi:hypothetical protein